MKACTRCGKQLEDQAEFCECGEWFRVARQISEGEPKRVTYNENKQDRLLHAWGGACGFLACSPLANKGGLIAVVFFAAGYLLSVGLVRQIHDRGKVLSTGHKWGLAALYFGSAIVGMVIVDQMSNR